MIDKILKDYDLSIHESEAEDRENIDFEVCDRDGNIAWVWGDGEPIVIDGEQYGYNYEVECDHRIVEYPEDDEHQGHCVVCGCDCDWHYENDIFDKGGGEVFATKIEVPDRWHEGDGGIIKDYIERSK